MLQVFATVIVALFGSIPLAFSQPALPPDPFLGDYPFDTTNWLSIDGDAPIASTNLVSVSLWNKNALLLDTTNAAPAFLNYNVVESDGFTNVTFDQGAVRCVFITDWATADTNQNGTGPGDIGYLVAAGDWSSGAPDGFWAIYIDPGGTNIYFGGVSNSTTNIFVSAPISWPSNSIHLIAALYSSTNSQLFLDGQVAATSGPVTIVPATNTWTNGFFVGSDNNGYEQARGVFSSLEFFDSNVFDPDWSEFFSGGYIFTNGWPRLTNAYYTWLAAQGGGFSFGGGGADYWIAPPTPTNSVNTNYANYANFWLIGSNSPTQVYVSVVNTLSNIAYEVLTNDNLASTNWGVWQAFVASNAVTPMPPLNLTSNALFFRGVMISQTGTNGLPDWWCLEYFNTLNVDPYADPDGDGLCNLDEFTLGTNPTNAYSLSALHKDAAALLLAFTNYDSGCTYQLSIASCSDTNVLLATITPTLVGTNYQIYSHDESDTNNTWIVETNFVGTNTSTTVPIYLNGRTLCLIGGYGEDSDGDGLPDGYEVLATWTDPYLPDTGLSGTGDGYKDPDGDGYSNLQEMFNGTNPHVFNTPSGPLAPVADFSDGTNELTLTWRPASGPVIGYVISVSEDYTYVPIATNSVDQLSYLISDLAAYGVDPGYYQTTMFSVTAIYTQGPSFVIPGGIVYHPAVAAMALAHGPSGATYLLTSAANSNVLAYTNFVGIIDSEYYPEANYYDQPQESYPGGYGDPIYNPVWFPASQFTNAIAMLTTNQMPLYASTFFLSPSYQISYALFSNNVLGNPLRIQNTVLNVPFIDGSQQMKQNVRFLLMAANDQSFAFALSGGGSSQAPTNYVYSSFYAINDFYQIASLDHFAPFEDNYFYRNFVFDVSSADTNGTYAAGFDPQGEYDSYYYEFTNTPAFQFPTYDYVTLSNQAPIPGLLPMDTAQWVGFHIGYDNGAASFGAYESGGVWGMSNYVNIFGLPYTALGLPVSNEIVSLSPGGSVTGYEGGYYFGNPFYVSTTEPELQTVGYYFGRPGTDPIPGFSPGYFDVTNVTPPLMLGSVGTPMLLAGYEKQAVLNGYTNVFAYLGQYFTNAFVVSNGVVTTNPTGVLSEYGEFFPTAPGQVALMTKPDPDQTNIQGTCLLDIIRLSLDVNHDGIMDESFTGPDNSSFNTPYLFWINNDYDRWTTDIPLVFTPYEDDVESNTSPAIVPFTGKSGPDCEYRDAFGNRIIPCPRDLEDYARLWVSGFSSNVLANLPSGSTVTLSWAGYGSSPTIDLFQAADSDGGIGYLTNLATASNQINTNLCPYIGRLGPGSNIVLNSSTFSNGWAGNHFIWCGVGSGLDQLNLTVKDGSGNVLAQSSQTLQIVDVKQMYERWTVGDNDQNKPMSEIGPSVSAIPLADNQPNGPTGQGYAYDGGYDKNDTYILYVHGWFESAWKKDSTAQTAFKRLYWQGYQGRFGILHWPCYSLTILNLPIFDESEWQSWKTGLALEGLLAKLNGMYPSNVYLYAHSQGNVASGEALRLATNQIVNTYVASQAAVSARAYDNTLSSDAIPHYSLLPTYTILTPDSEGFYYTNGASSYFNNAVGAGQYIDFFNPVDWALMGDKFTHPGWLKDQSSKPDGYAGYDYISPTLTIPFGYYYQHLGLQRQGRGVGNWPEVALQFPCDTYEIFAMCCQSYSLALGAQSDVGSGSGPFTSEAQVDLSGDPINFQSTLIYHDGQFTVDNMTVGPYWRQVLHSYNLK